MRFFALAVHPRDAILRAIPNGDKRDPVTAARLTGISSTQRDLLPDDDALRPAGQGVLPGSEDLNLLLPMGRCVLIEVKVPEILSPLSGLKLSTPTKKVVLHQAGRQSKGQKRFQAGAERLGHDYRLVTSLEAFVSLLAGCGVPMRAGVMGLIGPSGPPASR